MLAKSADAKNETPTRFQEMLSLDINGRSPDVHLKGKTTHIRNISKVYFSNSTGWTPKKQFCSSKSARLSNGISLYKQGNHVCSQVVKQWSD